MLIAAFQRLPEPEVRQPLPLSSYRCRDAAQICTINDFPLIPKYAVLDPKVTLSLPSITATTGMDALISCREVYIGRSITYHTRRDALHAVQLIFENIDTVYADGRNVNARRDAATHHSMPAAFAFPNPHAGYVHAVAHSLGGEYNVPHGWPMQ